MARLPPYLAVTLAQVVCALVNIAIRQRGLALPVAAACLGVPVTLVCLRSNERGKGAS